MKNLLFIDFCARCFSHKRHSYLREMKEINEGSDQDKPEFKCCARCLSERERERNEKRDWFRQFLPKTRSLYCSKIFVPSRTCG